MRPSTRPRLVHKPVDRLKSDIRAVGGISRKPMQSPHRIVVYAMHTGGMSSTRRILGVLGGMGPLATADFLMKIVQVTPATRDQDHLPLIVYQAPDIPDRSSAILSGSDAPFEPMLEGLRRLALAGAELACIPCNTAHYWYDRLRRMQSLPILHIADAARLELERRRGRSAGRIAVLATRGTHRAGIYTDRWGERFKLMPIPESVQLSVDAAVAAVKAGEQARAAHCARAAADEMLQRGADFLILACTELPLVLGKTALAERCIDTTMSLAQLCVREVLFGGAGLGSN